MPRLEQNGRPKCSESMADAADTDWAVYDRKIKVSINLVTGRDIAYALCCNGPVSTTGTGVLLFAFDGRRLAEG